MESGSEDSQVTLVVTPTPDQLKTLRLAASATETALEDFVLRAAVTAADSVETTLGEVRRALDTAPKPDQPE